MLAFIPWIGAPVAAMVLGAAYVLTPVDKLSAGFALSGALVAVLGVLTLARPIVRVGGYKAWYERSRTIDYGNITETQEESAEERQIAKDAEAVQIWGPALIVIGTLVNGASGFISA